MVKLPLDRIFTGPAIWPGGRQANGGYTLAYVLLKVILSGIFIYAGVVKLLDPRAFAHSIDQYGLVPEALLPAVALGLPALELLAGAGLVLEFRGSLATIAALLLMFLAVLGYALWLEMDIDCGCFTPEDLSARDGLKTAFRRDLALLAATAFLFWRRRVWRHNKVDKSTAHPQTEGGL